MRTRAQVTRPSATRWFLAAAIAALAASISLVLPAPTLAAVPANDNYLASARLTASDGTVPSKLRLSIDTREATEQADLFQPDRDGAPLGGGPPERLLCGTTPYGKTVWYDVSPDVPGGVEIVAGGFDTVVAVYEFDPRTAAIRRSLGCVNETAAGAERLSFVVRADRSYTIQVGGVASSGAAQAGLLDLAFTFFQDRDGDGVLDRTPDACPSLQGPRASGGCPPRLRSLPAFSWDRAGGGLRLTSVEWPSLPRGAVVTATCRRCASGGVRTRVQSRGPGTAVQLRRLTGVVGPSGATLDLMVTMAPRGEDRWRFGAIGAAYRYVFSPQRLTRTRARCVLPGQRTPRTRCR